MTIFFLLLLCLLCIWLLSVSEVGNSSETANNHLNKPGLLLSGFALKVKPQCVKAQVLAEQPDMQFMSGFV